MAKKTNGKVVIPLTKVNPVSFSEERMSDEDLSFFKILINDKKEKAIGLINSLRNSNRNSHGTEDTARATEPLEEGFNTMSSQGIQNAITRQEKFVEGCDYALIRIENKSYAKCFCAKCNGALMSKERMLNAPIATKCVAEKENQAQAQNSKVRQLTPVFKHLYV